MLSCPGFMVLVTWVKFLGEKLKDTIPLVMSPEPVQDSMVGFSSVRELLFAKGYIKDRTRIKQPKLNLVTVGRDSSFPLFLRLYYYIWNDIYLHTFQLLAALLTIYTYGYTHNSICVHTSTHLYTHISMYTYFHIFTHHIYIHFSDSESLKWLAFSIRTWPFVSTRPQPQVGVLAFPHAQYYDFFREFKRESTIGQP